MLVDDRKKLEWILLTLRTVQSGEDDLEEEEDVLEEDLSNKPNLR